MDCKSRPPAEDILRRIDSWPNVEAASTGESHKSQVNDHHELKLISPQEKLGSLLQSRSSDDVFCTFLPEHRVS